MANMLKESKRGLMQLNNCTLFAIHPNNSLMNGFKLLYFQCKPLVVNQMSQHHHLSHLAERLQEFEMLLHYLWLLSVVKTLYLEAEVEQDHFWFDVVSK